MRSLSYFVLTLVGVLLVGVTLVLVRPQSWLPQASASIYNLFGRPATPADKPSPLAEKSKPESAHKASPQAHRALEAAASPETPAPGAPPAVIEQHYPFPLAGQIASGSSKNSIIASFGRPEATVTGADTGQLRERYIYWDRATGRKTYIFLINAVVTHAETVSP
jgi:hypothetical protein